MVAALRGSLCQRPHMSLCPRWLLQEEMDLCWHVSAEQTKGFTHGAISESLSNLSLTITAQCNSAVPKHTERGPAQLHISQYKVSPLVVYLVMELQCDKAAAAERLYYST